MWELLFLLISKKSISSYHQESGVRQTFTLFCAALQMSSFRELQLLIKTGCFLSLSSGAVIGTLRRQRTFFFFLLN